MNLNTWLTISNVAVFIGFLLVASGGLGNFYISKKIKKKRALKTDKYQVDAVKDREIKHKREMEGFDSLSGDFKALDKDIKAFFLDQDNVKLNDFEGVKVLEENIIDAKKGYMRIKVNTNYLNSSFDMPVTLTYESGRYQPIMITFTNDVNSGPGIIITSPEYERRTVFYLTDFIKFKNLGRMTYTDDFIFDVYYNDFCIYFVTTSGAVFLDGPKLTINFKPNLISRPFDEKSYERAIKEFPKLEAYFRKHGSTN